MKSSLLDLKAGRAYAVRLLARREYSQHEITGRMRNKGYAAEVISKVLAWLNEHDLQSDVRFTQDFIRYRTRVGYGPVWIKSALREKGIADDLVAANISQDSQYWRDCLEQTWEKKFAGAQDLDSQKSIAKQMRFLAARGFYSADVSAMVLRKKAAYANSQG
jgi:regulatory protein